MTTLAGFRAFKVPLILLLCSMLILTGCYSYSLISRESGPAEIPDSDCDIRISTFDGRTIVADENYFIAVRERTDFIYGVGMRSQSGITGTFHPFHGIIDAVGEPTEIPAPSKAPGDAVVVFKLRDSSIAKFRKAEMIFVDSSKDAGLWCIGREIDTLGREKFLSGRIPFEQIQRTEVRTISASNTILLCLGIGGLMVGMAAVIGSPMSFRSAPVR